MSSTRKNNCWHFGMKAHIGADSKYSLVHTLVTTTAKVHDSVPLENLLHGQERELYGDKAYADKKKQHMTDKGGAGACRTKWGGARHSASIRN